MLPRRLPLRTGTHDSGNSWTVDYHQTPRPDGDFGQASLHPVVGLVPVVRDTVESLTQPNPPRRSHPAPMQHVALQVRDSDELRALRDRIRNRGIPAIGPVDHGFCRSLYFAGPEGVLLELTTGDPMGRQAWIDPEIIEINGISTGELEAYKNPAPFTTSADPVPDPAYDPAKPTSRSPLRPTNRSLPCRTRWCGRWPVSPSRQCAWTSA